MKLSDELRQRADRTVRRAADELDKLSDVLRQRSAVRGPTQIKGSNNQ